MSQAVLGLLSDIKPWRHREQRGIPGVALAALAGLQINPDHTVPPSSDRSATTGRPGRRRRITQPLRDEVIRRYVSDNQTALEISEECGIGTSTVLRILKTAEVPMRRQGRETSVRDARDSHGRQQSRPNHARSGTDMLPLASNGPTTHDQELRAVTVLLILLYSLAAALEVAAVGLIVYDVRESRRRWDGYKASIEAEKSAMATDMRFRLDPLVARYGFTPAQIMRTIGTVESLVEIKRWRQNLAVGSILGGLVLGLIGNLVSLGV